MDKGASAMKRAMTAALGSVAIALALSGYANAGTMSEYDQCAIRFKVSDGWTPEKLTACYVGHHELALFGTITAGQREFIVKLIQTDEGIETVYINSVGGDSYTAWAIGRVIRWHRIDTHAVNVCSSACMSIFINGIRRSATNGTQFGLHRPSDQFDKGMSKARAASWFATTSEFWRLAKADQELLKRGYDMPNHLMLYFGTKKARQANVINHRRKTADSQRTAPVREAGEPGRRKADRKIARRTGVNGMIPLTEWFKSWP